MPPLMPLQDLFLLVGKAHLTMLIAILVIIMLIALHGTQKE